MGPPTSQHDAVDPVGTVLGWLAAWQVCDTGALVGYLTPDATYVSATAGSLSDLPRQFKVGCYLWQRASMESFRIEGTEEADRLALVHGRFVFDGLSRDGRAVSFPAAVTFVLRRGDGGWRILRYHESALPERG